MTLFIHSLTRETIDLIETTNPVEEENTLPERQQVSLYKAQEKNQIRTH